MLKFCDKKYHNPENTARISFNRSYIKILSRDEFVSFISVVKSQVKWGIKPSLHLLEGNILTLQNFLLLHSKKFYLKNAFWKTALY